MSRSETAKSRSTVPAHSGPPELLSQIPGSLYTSPAFILGVVFAEFLYGFVLFGVMMANRPDPNAVKPDHIPYPGPGRPRTQLASTASPGAGVSPFAPAPAHPDPEATIVVPTRGAPEKAAPRKDDTRKKGGGNKKAGEPKKKDQMAKTGLAAVTPVKPAAAPKPPSPPTLAPGTPVGPFKEILDPKRDCRPQWNAGVFTLTVPGSMHALDPMFNLNDAPRGLLEADGDFAIQVKIPTVLKPGSKPLMNLPFVFQGAGLVLWLDEQNFIRLERAAAFSLAEMGGLSQKVLLETYKDGKQGKPFEATLKRDVPTVLRLDRRGNNFVARYSSDGGKTWLPAKNWASDYPSKVRIGVIATNISPKPLDARYEDFDPGAPPLK